jgi:hypothetical protein
MEDSSRPISVNKQFPIGMSTFSGGALNCLEMI